MSNLIPILLQWQRRYTNCCIKMQSETGQKMPDCIRQTARKPYERYTVSALSVKSAY